jgi:two-component system chemotaxis response regulator CheY
MKILIAEDDAVTRKLLRTMVEKWGHEAIEARNGADALSEVVRSGAKFMIVDWNMPGVDGIELCRRVRCLDDMGYVYIVLVTVNDRKEDVIMALESGADDHVSKPFDRKELRARVRAGERILDLERSLVAENDGLKSRNERLEELVSVDPLMGIGNRRGLFQAIEKAHHRFVRYGEQYGVVMCDVDHFKAYNDSYGHLAGDKALRAVADAMKKTLRVSDEIYRFGGEEIVLLTPRQAPEGVMLFADRLRGAVERVGIGHEKSARGVLTVSCGATVVSGRDAGSKWEDVLERADQALYLAKAAGRNAVRFRGDASAGDAPAGDLPPPGAPAARPSTAAAP